MTTRSPITFFEKTDLHFQDLYNMLDCVCVKKLRKSGVGAEVHHAPIITLQQEDAMWESGALGTDNPDCLLQTVFYTMGLHFSLRGVQEHLNLQLEQLKQVPADRYNVKTHYQYAENGSITTRRDSWK